MSDCLYCDLRSIERGEPHKFGCPGLEIERLRSELAEKEAKISELEAELDRADRDRWLAENPYCDG